METIGTANMGQDLEEERRIEVHLFDLNSEAGWQRLINKKMELLK